MFARRKVQKNPVITKKPDAMSMTMMLLVSRNASTVACGGWSEGSGGACTGYREEKKDVDALSM